MQDLIDEDFWGIIKERQDNSRSLHVTENIQREEKSRILVSTGD